MRNNLYQILKCMVKEMDTDKVLSTYYSVGRYERWFFNLFGPHVWRECKELHHVINPFGTDICQFKSFPLAMKLCNHLNKPLKDQLVKKHVVAEIIYDGADIDEK